MSEQERVIEAVNRLVELRPLIEQSMENAWGEDWIDERRRRAEQQGRQVSRTSGPYDPRFLLACIAFEEPLASIFSVDDRERARVLTTVANRAYHHDLDRLRSGDGDTATDTVEQLIAVGAGQPSRRRLSVGAVIDRAKAAASSEQERLEQEEADRLERVAQLRRVLSTFLRVMRDAGDPGATTMHNGTVRKTARRLFQDMTWKSSGWPMATYEGFLSRICFFSTDGNLWLCVGDGESTNPYNFRSLDLDDLVPRPEDDHSLRFDYYWQPVSERYHSTDALDGAIVTRIGELCLEYDLTWPEMDD